MKTHVKALVVGGGAVGTGIAYHLAKAGWDTMLVERDELTSGSTWHAAGNVPTWPRVRKNAKTARKKIPRTIARPSAPCSTTP